MAGDINRVPAGLLSILDMKARGQNPRQLAEQVAGTIDLLPLYLLQNRITRVGGTPQVSAPGTFAAVTVPDNEYWFVNRISVYTGGTLPAATEYILAPLLQRLSNIGTLIVTPLTMPSPRFLAGDRIGVAFEGPLWASPGDAFGAYVIDAVIGSPISFGVAVDYTPIPI